MEKHSLILHDGSELHLTTADLLEMDSYKTYCLFGSSFHEKEDLIRLGKTLAERSKTYEFWSKNLAIASQMFIEEGKEKLKAQFLSEYSQLSEDNQNEVCRLLIK